MAAIEQIGRPQKRPELADLRGIRQFDLPGYRLFHHLLLPDGPIRAFNAQFDLFPGIAERKDRLALALLCIGCRADDDLRDPLAIGGRRQREGRLAAGPSELIGPNLVGQVEC